MRYPFTVVVLGVKMVWVANSYCTTNIRYAFQKKYPKQCRPFLIFLGFQRALSQLSMEITCPLWRGHMTLLCYTAAILIFLA